MPRPATDVLAERLAAYYTRYYRDTLGIPGWRDIVAVRVADQAYETRRLAQLERALGGPVRDRRLLNLGCGTGGFSEAAERAGAEVWSVDASPEAVAITAARADDARALVAAAEALPFAAGSFDVVYCFSTLEHVADPGAAIREMVRVLRRHGTIYLHTPNRWACFEGHYKIFWVPGLPRGLARAYLGLRGRPTAFLETLRLLSVAECRALVERAGARVVRLLGEDTDRPVGGPLWPVVRSYYRLCGVRPYIELVATRETGG